MIHTLVQLAGGIAAAAGVYLLLGLAPALVIVGTLVLVCSAGLEIMGGRRQAPAPLAPEAPRVGELAGRRSKPVDPAASGAPEEE